MAYSNPTGLPSVSDILRPYVDTDWYTEESRDRGQAVHAAIRADLEGSYVIPLPRRWRGYWESYCRWRDKFGPVPILVEQRLIDERLRYCGQLDVCAVVELIGKGAGLIDFKTSISKHKIWPIALAGYRNLLKVNGYGTAWAGNLRIRADGSMPIYDQASDDYSSDFNRFLGCVNMYHYMEEG